MEPEETVGNLWHGVGRRAAPRRGPCRRRRLRAAAPERRGCSSAPSAARRRSRSSPPRHRLAPPPRGRDRSWPSAGAGPRGRLRGERLRLPPVIDAFPTPALNRAAYLWLAALAAIVVTPESAAATRSPPTSPSSPRWRRRRRDALAPARACGAPMPRWPRICCATRRACAAVGGRGGGRGASARRSAARAAGRRSRRPRAARLPALCAGADPAPPRRARQHAARRAGGDDTPRRRRSPPRPARRGKREERDQANRKDSFIIHRFEAIMSWAESLNLNRTTDDDDPENAAEGGRGPGPHHPVRRTSAAPPPGCACILDLVPQDAEHERLSARFTYPEWNHRARALHARPLPRAGGRGAQPGARFAADPRLVARVRRQFAPLHPRRVLLSRQIDGSDLDLDAVVAAQGRRSAPGATAATASGRRPAPVARDLSVAILIDCSRSTEAAMGDAASSTPRATRWRRSPPASTRRATGSAIWGFSSLRRDRVFLTRAKGFDEPMSPDVTARIGGFRPGHYTRLGAAIRHASAMLAAGDRRPAAAPRADRRQAQRPRPLRGHPRHRGQPHGGARGPRALGQSVHGVIVDADGQDWFARIFGRAGLHPAARPGAAWPRAAGDLPDPDHGDLTCALPLPLPAAARAGFAEAFQRPVPQGETAQPRSPTSPPRSSFLPALVAVQWLVSRR